MVFSSSVFLFLFLPIVFAVYYAILRPGCDRPNLRHGNLWLLFVSAFFYFWGEQWLLWIVIASSLIDYTIGYQLGRSVTPHDEAKLRPLTIDMKCQQSVVPGEPGRLLLDGRQRFRSGTLFLILRAGRHRDRQEQRE